MAEQRAPTNAELLAAIRENLTIDLMLAGQAVGRSRSATYRSKKDLGAIRIGGRWVVPTAPLRRLLGIEDARAA